MNILHVDDHEDQAVLVKAAFEVVGIEATIHHVDSGRNCLSFLRKEAAYGSVPTPDLILLDINMPRMNGFQVLECLANDPAFKCIPVVVLTTSSSTADIRKSYALGCNSFITKPLDFDQLAKAMGQLGSYWFELVALPVATKEG